jgi:hypothetical protein
MFIQLVLKGGFFLYKKKITRNWANWCIDFFLAAKIDYDILLGAIASRQ